MSPYSYLYQYVLHPITTIKTKTAYIPIKESLLIIILLSLKTMCSLLFDMHNVLLLYCIILLGYFAYLYLTSVCYDFLAQMMKRTGQSVRLFCWLAMSMMPLLLLQPIHILFTSFPPTPILQILKQTIMISLNIYVFWLQINTIKYLYQVNLKRSVIIYFAPIILSIFIAITAIIMCITLWVTWGLFS